MEMIDLVKLSQFGLVDKLKIDDDGSCIKISRPDTYSKAWSLSKKELEILVQKYFQNANIPSSEGCFNFIVEQRKRSLISKDFEFSRVIPEE
jgi:hypothetical protein